MFLDFAIVTLEIRITSFAEGVLNMFQTNPYLVEAVERENRERILKAAENARLLSQLSKKDAEKSNGRLVILEKLIDVREKLSAAVRMPRWSFR
jgi:hypothetical protein